MDYSVASFLDLEKLAKKVLENLKPGDILALKGDLAAGKTTFTQALLKAMGYDGAVNSPTFVIEHRYPVNWKQFTTVLHLDLYRLGGKELTTLDWDDYLKPQGQLTIIEWPEKASAHLPKSVKTITIEILDEKSRRFYLSDNLSA